MPIEHTSENLLKQVVDDLEDQKGVNIPKIEENGLRNFGAWLNKLNKEAIPLPQLKWKRYMRIQTNVNLTRILFVNTLDLLNPRKA